MDQLTVPAGTIIKIKGMPFELTGDTPVLGLKENFQFAFSQSDTLVSMPDQALSEPVISTTNSRDDASV